MRTKLPVGLVGLTMVIGMMISLPVMAGMSSANYQIPNDVISGGGSAMSSANYQLVGTLGQSSPLGTASAASYTNYPGFWQADECVFDADADSLTNAEEYGLGTDAYDPDTDNDDLNDGEEVCTCLDGYMTDPLIADTDDDGLDDGDEYLNGTIPSGSGSSDTDKDGLGDGEEVHAGLDSFITNPLKWDTDGDALPDKFESDNSIGPPPYLSPINAADGALDGDTDGNPNVHEYWNGTDYRVKNPKGGEGCYYWGDATGDSFIGALDITMLTSRIKGPADYSRVIPNNGETQDLDDNGFWGAVDTTLLIAFAKSQSTEGIATRPDSIVKLSSETASVQVGNTTHVTVALHNLHGTNTPGFGVVFSIDPSSTGTAVILGGDGANTSGYRYDVTGAKSILARSNVVILVKTPGTIKINAGIPQCGMLVDLGRYCSALTMTEPFIITGI